MRKHLLLFLLTCLLPASSPARGRSGWKLVWKEDFKGKTIDESVWSRIPKKASRTGTT